MTCVRVCVCLSATFFLEIYRIEEASASSGIVRHYSRGVPERGPKLLSFKHWNKAFPGTRKKINFFENVAQKILPGSRRYLGAEGAILKVHFAEDESLHPQFPSRELRAHLPRGSSLVLNFG